MFVGKAKSLTQIGAPESCFNFFLRDLQIFVLSMLCYVRLDGNAYQWQNTIAYYENP